VPHYPLKLKRQKLQLWKLCRKRKSTWNNITKWIYGIWINYRKWI